MTEGEVVSIDASRCRGWATNLALSRYALTIHLVLDGMVQTSTIADRKAEADEISTSEEDCWFQLDMPAAIAKRAADCRVLVGETGDYLHDPRRGGGAGSAAPSTSLTPRSYRDALDLGLSSADIINLLYLDILRRPADGIGLRMMIAELQSGRGSFESFRRDLLGSQEYLNLSLRVREAPGRTFARPIVYASSTRRLAMERHAAEFQHLNTPLRSRLLNFLPGLVAMPGATDALLALSDKGLPDREIYLRALAMLSQRPSLIVADRRKTTSVRSGAASPTSDDTVTLACTSSLFVHGWNRVEDAPTLTFRWMEQVGVVLNPRPESRIARFEVQVEDWYGALDRNVTAVANGAVLSFERSDKGRGTSLSFASPDGTPFAANRVALVAAAATCPWRYDGTPDMRLISCQITSVRFRYQGATA